MGVLGAKLQVMTSNGLQLFREGALRPRVVAVYVVLAMGNVAAWAWAVALFHNQPVLLGTAFLAYGSDYVTLFCNSKRNRAACRERGIVAVIPYRATTKNKPKYFPKRLYRGRARIEQAIGKLKRFKWIAMRCEKTAESFAAFVAFACGLILVKSVHRA